jgi:glyoxylase-like metal-dependent hydrolase (beta-lactamase superfamily II)
MVYRTPSGPRRWNTWANPEWISFAALAFYRADRRSDLRRLLLTHFHEDHVGSAADVAAWGDITVYAHRADAPVIRGERAGPPPKLADGEQVLLDRVRTQLPAQPPAPAPGAA